MMLANPLQLQQLQLFWEQVCLWEFWTILPEAHLWGQTLMLDVNSWPTATVSALIHPKGVRSGPGQPGSSHTPKATIHVFMVLSLCIGVQSCGNRKGPSPNCSIKDGSMMPRMPWYAEASKVPLTGTQEPKQPPTPPPNFTLCTIQSDKYGSPGNHQTQTRPSDFHTEESESL